MALLSKAIRWLEPAFLLPRRRPQPTAPLDTGNSVPHRIQHQFLTLPGVPQPLPADSVERNLMQAALTQWRQGYHSAVAFLGGFGAGKTTLLDGIQLSFPDDLLGRHRFTSRVLGETQLLIQLADSLGLPPPENVDDLAAHLQGSPKQAILLDDCHLLFLRRPGGFAPLDVLLRLIRATDRHILWITTWNVYSWAYLEHVRSLSDHFANIHLIPPQSPEKVREMLVDRVERSSLRVVWPADETEEFARAIWSAARGRPALAQHIFLRSLYPIGENQFTLRADAVHRPPQQCQVKDGEEAYALGNLIRHSVLTTRELASINHVSETRAAEILARTTAKGLTTSLEPDYRLNPLYADGIVAYLDSRRAISFREVEAS